MDSLKKKLAPNGVSTYTWGLYGTKIANTARSPYPDEVNLLGRPRSGESGSDFRKLETPKYIG